MVPCGVNYPNRRTIPNGLQAEEVKSGSMVLIISGFRFSTTSCRSALEEDERLVMSAFLIYKTYQRRVSAKVVKRLSVYLPSWVG